MLGSQTFNGDDDDEVIKSTTVMDTFCNRSHAAANFPVFTYFEFDYIAFIDMY